MSLTTGVEMPARDRAELLRWKRTPLPWVALAQRPRIVLLADEGIGTHEVVQRIGMSKPTLIARKKRHAFKGFAGLDDRPKRGRPAQVHELAVVPAAHEPPPAQLSVTHWSSRLLPAQVGMSNAWVANIWKRWGLAPWRRHTRR